MTPRLSRRSILTAPAELGALLVISLVFPISGCRKPAEKPTAEPVAPTKQPTEAFVSAPSATEAPPPTPPTTTGPVLPPPETRDVDEMSVAKLVAAHRRAVGVLDDTKRGLKTVSFAYEQSGEQASLYRSLMCDATGRAKLTYILTPPTLRGAPEGASFDGQTLWRLSYRGVVRGPRASLQMLKGDVGLDLAWVVLELGVTPLYNPLVDQLGFEINKEEAYRGHAELYGLNIGPPDDPYMRVILDRKTHLIHSIERLVQKRVVQKNELRDYTYDHVLEMNLPKTVLSYSNPLAEEPTATWHLAGAGRRSNLQKQEVFARGVLPDLRARMGQRGDVFRVHQQTIIPLDPQQIHAVDLDQDGRTDLVIPAYSAVVAMYNDGKTPLGEWMPLLERKELHRYAASADLNGSGRPDLIVSSQRAHAGGVGQDVLYILPNKGGRRFDDPMESKAPREPEQILPCELNGDDTPDLAIVSAGNSKLLVFLGPVYRQPAPNFMKDLNGRGRRVAAGDFNGDGLLDLVTTNEASIDLFTQTTEEGGPLSFKQTNMAVTEVPYAIVSADFDGDGRPDIAVGSGGDLDTAADPEVVVLKPTADGRFEPMTTLVSGLGVTDLAAVDFDEDGDIDLAASCFEDHSVYVWLNNGNGTFGEPESYLTDYGPRGLAAADFDGDGHIDLAVVNEYGNSMTLLVNITKDDSQPATDTAPVDTKNWHFDPGTGKWASGTTQPAGETN